MDSMGTQEPATLSSPLALEMALPNELDIRAPGLGFTMHGWDLTRAEVARAIRDGRMLNPAMELGTNICPWNCGFCFTERPDNPDGRKRRLAGELSLEARLSVVDQAAALGARSINFVGAGEPTIDPDFWTIVERIHERNMTPIIYSEASLRLGSPAFVERLFALGATVVVKVNSLENADYQNAILRGSRGGAQADRYTEQRNHAIDVLIDAGFTSCEPTRLAFDTIVCQQNAGEIEAIHRHARKNNIFVLFVNYLPSGRSSDNLHDALDKAAQRALFERLADIDAREFGIEHAACFPYAGGVPCTIRGMGLFVKITGKVFDCPGESMPLGDLELEPLAAIWARAKPIMHAFDGGCAPREAAWQRMHPIRLPLLPKTG
jgi:molybdenum cofactor biosynthesis enzyme MoaA